ncbi:UNVERIFIED_CONTAM: Transposable element Tcb2 transposase [Trichonephila clavipes]
MPFTQRPSSGTPRQTSRQEDRHIVQNARVQPTALSAAIQVQVAPSLGASVPSRTIQKRMSEEHLGSRCLLRVPLLTPTHRSLRLEWYRARGNWIEAEWNQVVFSDESRFNLSSDGNHVHVWRPRGERHNPAFDLQQHNTPTAGVRVWGAIAYNTRSPQVLIWSAMTAQLYVHDNWQTHVLSLMQRLPGAIFKQDSARPHMARVSQDWLRTVISPLSLPDPQICLQSSTSGIV